MFSGFIYLHFCVFHLTLFIHVIESNDATLRSISWLPVYYTCKTQFYCVRNRRDLIPSEFDLEASGRFSWRQLIRRQVYDSVCIMSARAVVACVTISFK
jgi:hypothetical protein